jgi:hypothetical protein
MCNNGTFEAIIVEPPECETEPLLPECPAQNAQFHNKNHHVPHPHWSNCARGSSVSRPLLRLLVVASRFDSSSPQGDTKSAVQTRDFLEFGGLFICTDRNRNSAPILLIFCHSFCIGRNQGSIYQLALYEKELLYQHTT